MSAESISSNRLFELVLGAPGGGDDKRGSVGARSLSARQQEKIDVAEDEEQPASKPSNPKPPAKKKRLSPDETHNSRPVGR